MKKKKIKDGEQEEEIVKSSRKAVVVGQLMS